MPNGLFKTLIDSCRGEKCIGSVFGLIQFKHRLGNNGFFFFFCRFK